MSLFKHAMVSGINDALVDRGIVSWPNEAVGFEVCSKIAADLSGPDMLPEGGLAKESALLIGERIKEAADTLIAEGYGPDASAVLRTKQAAAMDFTDRAAWVAEACMSKAAEEASLTSVGPNTAESAVQTDQHAALDQHNRATDKYLMGVGRTAFPSGGVVGQQMLAPGAPNRAGRNSLTSLDKQAFAVTNEGHALDAANAAAARDFLQARQDASRAYGEKAPIRRMLSMDPLAELGDEITKRHMHYTASRHAQGENALNPFGGMLTPVQKQAFAVTDEGHAYDAAVNRAAANMLDRQQKARQAYMEAAPVRGLLGTAPGAEMGLEAAKRHLAYTAGRHEQGENALNPFGGLMTPYSEKKSFSVTNEGHALDAANAAAARDFLQARQDASRAYGEKAPIRRMLSMDPLAELGDEITKRHMHYTAGRHAQGENALNPFGGMLTPVQKQANEEMAAADLAGSEGADPGRMERAMMFLRGLKNKLPGFRPSPEAQVAAAGLGESGTPGMEVMAHVLDTVKTAADAEDVLQQILHHQGEAGELASPELVEAIQEELHHGEDPEVAAVQSAMHQEDGEAPTGHEVAAALKVAALQLPGRAESVSRMTRAMDLLRQYKKPLMAAGALTAAGAAAYGGKKYLDHRKENEQGHEVTSGVRETMYRAKARAGEALAAAARRGAHEVRKTTSVAKGIGKAIAGDESAREYLNQNRGRAAGVVASGALAAGGLAAGGKKLHDKMRGSASEAPAEEQKAAALLNYLKAAAEGSLTDVGENTEQSAAHTDSVAELDMKNRAPGAYLAGVGNTRMPNKGQVYAVEPAHQDSPVHTDNLPTNETKSAELAYVGNFRKIASELGPYLPATMERGEKVAHLQALMGMPPSERSGYLKALRAG